ALSLPGSDQKGAMELVGNMKEHLVRRTFLHTIGHSQEGALDLLAVRVHQMGEDKKQGCQPCHDHQAPHPFTLPGNPPGGPQRESGTNQGQIDNRRMIDNPHDWVRDGSFKRPPCSRAGAVLAFSSWEARVCAAAGKRRSPAPPAK